jgi:D-alanyl-D-alanine carboxypeptidase
MLKTVSISWESLVMSTPFASLLHTHLQHCAQEMGTPAILVGISQGQQIVLILASQPPNSPPSSIGVNDWMRVGSVTKLFTATLLLRLVEAGRVSLTTPIAHWYPHLPNANQITVRHLLQHTSGFANYTDMPQFFAQAIDGRSWTITDILACLPPSSQLFAPGTGWAYANTNYVLLGGIIEHLTQLPIAQAFDQWLLIPLRLRRTLLDMDDAAAGLIDGYGRDPASGQVMPMTHVLHPSSAHAAGALVATVTDLILFSQAVLAGSFLQPETMHAMHQMMPATTPQYPFGTGYGLGVSALRLGSEEAYGHPGNIPGYSSLIAYLPKRDLHLGILLNHDYAAAPNGMVNTQFIAETLITLYDQSC